MRVTEELFVEGNPMYGTSGADCYSYRLHEIIDQKERVIRVIHYHFDEDAASPYNRLHTQANRGGGGGDFYKLVGKNKFAQCRQNDKGNWILIDRVKYRRYIYLIDEPVKTSLDPSF